jgi:opacity protein-like surface antigen
VGLRYDASESVAVKLQYDYTRLRRQEALNGLSLQVGFTF